MAVAYYNEIDPDAALVLKALIDDGVIAPGDVDTRSIKDVQPDDLRPYSQCHFFAGGGLWSVAARLAGWPDDRELWTGSCPCQPFSVAGKGGGVDDARHLWPDFFRLISSRRPAVVVGEQVAGKAGYGWLDGVRADLAREGYAGRGVDIPACAVDAPHIRQRLYWVALADADCGRRAGRTEDPQRSSVERAAAERPDDVEHAPRIGRAQSGRPASSPDGGIMGDADHHPFGAGARGMDGSPRAHEAPASDQGWHGDAARHADAHYGRNGSWWADHEWIVCHDGKARRTQPGTPLLVDGLPGRVGLWRIAGNAISPVLAAEVIAALMDVHQPETPER